MQLVIQNNLLVIPLYMYIQNKYPNKIGLLIRNAPGTMFYISSGIMFDTNTTLSSEQFIESADKALYQAKKSGRDQYFLTKN